MNKMGMYYNVKGYNNGECLVQATFTEYVEAKAFANNCRFADCDVWLMFNGKVICEM